MKPVKKKVAILVDSSSLILIYSAGLLTDVVRWYDVLIPFSVFEEITISDKPGADYFKALGVHGKYQILDSPTDLHLVKDNHKAELLDMGRGERDVLMHTLIGHGSFIVVDDFFAARFCVRYEIPFINALLVPKILYLAGVISLEDFGSSLANIEKHGRYSNAILKRAKSFNILELSQFFPENRSFKGRT